MKTKADEEYIAKTRRKELFDNRTRKSNMVKKVVIEDIKTRIRRDKIYC